MKILLIILFVIVTMTNLPILRIFFSESFYYSNKSGTFREFEMHIKGRDYAFIQRRLKSFKDENLLTVCLNDDCDDEANNDPYSFKATIVLPGYISRFKNLIFRKYAEKIFRQEAPAHVLLKICWVNASDMLGFQKKYKKL